MNSALLKLATGNAEAEISASIGPFPYTYIEEGKLNEYNNSSIGMYVAMGIAFIPALITSFLVMEKQTHIKH